MNMPVNLYLEELNNVISSRPEILNEWVLANRGFNQYAGGICGVNRWGSITFKEMDVDEHNRPIRCLGFRTKGEWRKYLSKEYIKDLTYCVKGTPTPYGHIGAIGNTIKSFKLKDLLAQYPSGKWYVKEGPFDFFDDHVVPNAIDGRKYTTKEQ